MEDKEEVLILLTADEYKTIMEALNYVLLNTHELPSGGNSFAIYDFLADELPNAPRNWKPVCQGELYCPIANCERCNKCKYRAGEDD
jgi:hypothetical protein